MDDILGILAVAVFYLFVAISGNKKKKARNARQRAARARKAAFSHAFDEQAVEPVWDAVPGEMGDAAHDQGCEMSRMHLHEVTQQQLEASAEGDDPCHRGGMQQEQNTPEADGGFSYDEGEENADGFAQEVLRGIIMSEILTRPCKRTGIGRNGWSGR